MAQFDKIAVFCPTVSAAVVHLGYIVNLCFVAHHIKIRFALFQTAQYQQSKV